MLDMFKITPEMEEMFKLLVVLGIMVACNIAGGLYTNIKKNEVKFKWRKLLSGIAKALCIAVMFIGLAFVLYTVPELSDVVGMQPKAILLAAIGTYVVKVTGQLMEVYDVKKETVQKEAEVIDVEYVDM